MSEADVQLAFPGDETKCGNPWGSIITCPITLYTILVIIFAIWQLWNISQVPTVDINGRTISGAAKWGWGLLTLIIYLIIAFLFGRWIYSLCLKCNTGGAWGVFLLAIFFPMILGLIASIIFGALVGVGNFLTKGNKGGKGVNIPNMADPNVVVTNPLVVV